MDMNYPLLILLMTLGSAIPRIAPLCLASNAAMDPKVKAWLNHVPVAVFAGVVFPGVLVQNGDFQLPWNHPFPILAVVVAVAAFRLRSVPLPVVIGVGLLAALRYFHFL